MTAPALWVDSAATTVPVPRETRLREEVPLQELLAFVAHLVHRAWRVLAVLGSPIAALLPLRETHPRLFKEPFNVVVKIRRADNVPPPRWLLALLPVVVPMAAEWAPLRLLFLVLVVWLRPLFWFRLRWYCSRVIVP